MFQAVIFDFDDVIVDTSRIKYRAYSQVLKSYGIEITEKEYIKEWLKTGSGVKAAFARNGDKLNFENFRKEGTTIYLGLLETELKAIDGALQVLNSIKIKKGLGSNSKGEHVLYCLDRLGIRNKFNAIVTGDDVSRPKPDPEIYRKAANLLEVDPEDCLVVDDHPIGIKAAKAAGMIAVAFPHGYTKDQDFSEADYVLKNMSGLPKLIKKLNN